MLAQFSHQAYRCIPVTIDFLRQRNTSILPGRCKLFHFFSCHFIPLHAVLSVKGYKKTPQTDLKSVKDE